MKRIKKVAEEEEDKLIKEVYKRNTRRREKGKKCKMRKINK